MHELYISTHITHTSGIQNKNCYFSLFSIILILVLLRHPSVVRTSVMLYRLYVYCILCVIIVFHTVSFTSPLMALQFVFSEDETARRQIGYITLLLLTSCAQRLDQGLTVIDAFFILVDSPCWSCYARHVRGFHANAFTCEEFMHDWPTDRRTMKVRATYVVGVCGLWTLTSLNMEPYAESAEAGGRHIVSSFWGCRSSDLMNNGKLR